MEILSNDTVLIGDFMCKKTLWTEVKKGDEVFSEQSGEFEVVQKIPYTGMGLNRYVWMKINEENEKGGL